MRNRAAPRSYRRRHRRGAAMLEAALTLLVFLMMLLAVLDFGQFLYVHQSLTERVRYAARTGAVRMLDATAIKNLVAYGSQEAPSGDNPPGLLGVQPSNVYVAFEGAGTNAYRLRVWVSGVRYPIFSPLLSRPFATNMAVRATFPLETPN